MKYYFKSSAFRDLRKLPKEIQRKIIKKLDYFTSSSEPLNFAEPLRDFQFGNWRFRIGDYRVLFDVEKDTVVILKVGHRKDIYK